MKTTDTPASMSALHSPLPWVCVHNSWEISTIYASGKPVASAQIDGETTEETQDKYESIKDANAALIVRAVNSHAQLVAALESALNLLTDGDAEPSDADCVTAIVRAALNAAKGE